MKKRGVKVGVSIGLVLALSVIALIVGFSAPKDTAVARINGSPVFKEEFLMLLRQNEMQYENQLREEYSIPGEQSVLAYLGGNEAEYHGLMFEQNFAYITSCRMEQALAQEYGLASEFTYQSFLDTLEAENQSRAEKIAKGEVVYGLQRFSAEQYYSYLMSNVRQALLRTLPDEMLGVTDEEIVVYYNDLKGFAHLAGERIYYTLYDVTDAEAFTPTAQDALYSEIRTALIAKTYGEVSVEGRVFPPEKRGMTASQLRDFIGQSFDAEFLLTLAVDEVTEVFSLGGQNYIAQYNGFEKAETLADNEKDVFRAQLEETAYENLIAERVAQADVRINQKAIDKMYKEEER